MLASFNPTGRKETSASQTIHSPIPQFLPRPARDGFLLVVGKAIRNCLVQIELYVFGFSIDKFTAIRTGTCMKRRFLRRFPRFIHVPARRTIPSCCSWEGSQLHLSHSREFCESFKYHVRECCTGEGGSGRTRQAVAPRALRESGVTTHHWKARAELVMVMCCDPGFPQGSRRQPASQASPSSRQPAVT